MGRQVDGWLKSMDTVVSTDGETEGWMRGWTDGRMDGWTDGRMRGEVNSACGVEGKTEREDKTVSQWIHE